MRKLFAIIQREYLTRVKTKGFVIGTLLMPVFIVFITIAPAAFMAMKSEEPRHIALVDLTKQVYDPLSETLDERTKTGERIYQLHLVAARSDRFEEVKNNLKADINQKKIDAYLIIHQDVFETNNVEYHSTNVSNFRENSEIERAISRVVTKLRLERSGFVPDEVNHLVQSVKLNTFKIGPGGKEQKDVGLSFAITYIMVFVLYLALILYGAMTMRSIVEDKNNRVIEVIISAVKPFHLMAGKILGIGAVGLTQFFIWAAVAGFLSLYSSNLVASFLPSAGDVPLPSVSLSQLIFFVLFFILGFFFYSTLYAGIGALVNSDQEAQQLQWPVISFLIVAFLLVFYTMSNPDSNLSILFSVLPMFSPILMFMRISVHTPPTAQVAAAVIILILSVWAMIWFVARIFRIGILMYGKRPNLPEVVKWVKHG
ncbi:MAG: ABC transporter permease [Gemmatimonadota bacterium]|nr:MAG: ABC transporter permease [Gemmatimonadota bacterium]